MSVAEVFAGTRRWACVQSDCIAFLNSLPDDSIDLLVTSPPYLEARTYSESGISRKIDVWVPWMMDVFRAAAPKVKGLIAVNCEGQTRNYAYQPAPFLLLADLYRAGFNVRKPPIFHRVGIPGSGGPDWLRNDYEPVICVTRDGRLPWSDNTACGKPPKYEPGGDISHRTISGARVNAKRAASRRETTGDDEPQVVAVMAGEIVLPPGSVLISHPRADGTMRTKVYRAPELANPGNVISLNSGYGHMGSVISHSNEAPFPLDLPAFFVKSFCPPNGVTCDIFSGSGTTAHAAFENGRRFVGCDLRASQVALAAKRLATVTPSMFTEPESA